MPPRPLRPPLPTDLAQDTDLDNRFDGVPPQPSTLDIVQFATDVRSLFVVIAGCVDSMRTTLPRDVASEELLFDLDRALDGGFRITGEMLTLARRTGEIGVVDLHDLVVQNVVLLERMIGPDVSL